MLTRSDVVARWRGLIEGSVDRKTVWEWTRQFVESGSGDPAEPLALSGTHYLHGYSALQTASGDFLKTTIDMKNDLDRWLDDCAEHDADPIDWPRRRSLRYLAAMQDRSDPTTRAYARTCVDAGWITEDEATELLGDPGLGPA